MGNAHTLGKIQGCFSEASMLREQTAQGSPIKDFPHAFHDGAPKAGCLCSARPGVQWLTGRLGQFRREGGETTSHAQRPAWLQGVSRAEYRAQHFRSVYRDTERVLQLQTWRLQHALEFTARFPDVM